MSKLISIAMCCAALAVFPLQLCMLSRLTAS